MEAFDPENDAQALRDQFLMGLMMGEHDSELDMIHNAVRARLDMIHDDI